MRSFIERDLESAWWTRAPPTPDPYWTSQLAAPECVPSLSVWMDGSKRKEKKRERLRVLANASGLTWGWGVGRQKKVHHSLGGEEINLEKKPCRGVAMRGLRTWGRDQERERERDWRQRGGRGSGTDSLNKGAFQLDWGQFTAESGRGAHIYKCLACSCSSCSFSVPYFLSISCDCEGVVLAFLIGASLCLFPWMVVLFVNCPTVDVCAWCVHRALVGVFKGEIQC